ncbi:MAG: hypothetical protein JL50_13235 [Peptococcaceae bacterium BICA1-7]|nr:MAG: hypothetical protein JL50_13235 [Peptococcaceae bacterium BICA1-7]
MKKKPAHRLLSLVLAVALTFAGMPMQAQGAVNIKSGLGTVKSGLSSSAPPFTAIGFGGKQWDVIGYNGTGVYSAANTMTLLLKNGQSVGADGQFHKNTVNNQYNGSTLQEKMNDAFTAISDAREKGLVLPRSLGWTPNYGQTGYNADGIGGPSLSDVNFWPLSVAEANQLNNEVLKFSSTYWWLRTPGSMDTCEAYAAGAGSVWPEGFYVGTEAACRPAFRLNAADVLFTSDAAGGKAGATGTLSSAAAPTGVIKLTVKDANTANLNLTVTDKSARAAKSGDTLSVSYAGAVTGAGKYVSCVIAGADGSIKYYGKLVDLTGGSAAPDGTAGITLPADMPQGTYTLRLFNEEIKGNNQTDFASQPENISLTVDAPPAVSAITPANGAAGKDINGQIVITFSEPINTAVVGSVSLSGGGDTKVLTGGVWSNSDKTYTVNYSGLDTDTQYTVSVSGFKDLTGNMMTANSANTFTTGGSTASIPLAATVGFGGKQWVVIGNHGQGVYSAPNTMTLLLKSGQSIGDKTVFDAFDPLSNIYGASDLKAAMDNAFSSGWSPMGREKDLIQGRTLEGGSGNQGTGSYDPNKIAGDPAEEAKFWPLSVYEYNQLPSDARAFGDSDGWWLRSPGYADSAEAMVKNSILYDLGTDVSPASPSRGLRPAFRLNTGTFFFISPAVGGKSGAAGSTLSAATQPAVAMKFSLKYTNPAVLNLDVSDKTPRTVSAGETFSVAYTGAVTGTDKYVSCVLAGADGSVKYYGKLKDLTGGSASPAGVADITLPADLPAGAYTLRLFNEEINGDNFTDFAGTPEDIALTVDALPAVAAITPANGAVDVSTSCQMVIIFSDPMNTSAGVGAVSLSGGGDTIALSGGVWSNGDKTYTVDYTGLDNDTEYTVSISGFKDQANNVMRTVNNHKFTTGGTTSSIPLNAIIGFGGKQWAVIGSNGQGVYSAANTMTLLLQNGQSFGGSLRFDASAPHSNFYSISDLKTAMESAFNGLPEAREKDLVQGRTLAGGSGNVVDENLPYDPDKIAGDQVDDAKFWPLSEYEYGQLPSNLRVFSGTDGWWLRSPANIDYAAFSVDSTGNIDWDSPSNRVFNYHALRPAFRMNLQPVFFTSPAAGGKPGVAGSALSVFSQPTGAMKFTMKDTDTGNLNLSVSNKNPKTVRPGAALSIGYTGAVTGTDKYVSCVITGANNTIKYYGKLVDLTGGSATPDGAASITLPADMPEGTYTLRLFNEEIKGDNQTDFASTPENISLTVDAAAPTGKILVSVTAPTDIAGVANGKAKTAVALGLPSTVTLVTDDGSVQSSVTWDVYGCSYDPSFTTEQTFTVDGTAALPGGVINPDSVSLEVAISVTVLAATTTDKTLVSITAPNDITGVANGTAKTAIALGLPYNVTLVTDVGNVSASVTWAVYGCSYDPSVTTEQTFTVDGTITLPNGVVNTNDVDLTVTLSVTVNAASAVPTYTITASAGSGGSISPSGAVSVTEGGSKTFTITPADGYRIASVTVDGVNQGDISSFTFNNVTASHIISATFSATGVNGGGSSGGGGGGPTHTNQPVSSTSGAASVNPAAGGSVSLGSDVTLNIPANALQGNNRVQVAVQKVDTPPSAPSGLMVVGTAYQFTVNGQDHYSFDKPVTLTFTFDPAKLAPGETPAVYYYDENEGRWVDIGGTVSGNTVTVIVDHFTRFAVLAKEDAPLPEPKPATSLTDIAGHWAEKNIEKLIEMGAVSGYPDGTFKPDAGITRAEFTAMLVKAFKLQGKGEKTFADIAGHWAREVIATAASSGIIGGYDQNSFGPDDPVTREQMAVMTVKAAKISRATGELAFDDNKEISAWAYDSIVMAVKDGIIKGYQDNTFRPGGKATRAEAVTMIVNALE